MPAGPTVSLDAKVRFLERTEAYPDSPSCVETVETHFAYVFLTNGLAYKLKKPIRFHSIDFTTLRAREASCRAEIALNRRLAERVYLDVVALTARDGRLALGEIDDARIVDWLVKMHCLPRERMLDVRAAQGDVGEIELRALVAKLAAFYARAPRAGWDGPAYLHHLEHQSRIAGAELGARAGTLPDANSAALVEDQLAFLEVRPRELAARCSAGRIVDAHGDLRPEHIWLAEDPQIIDCLEFSAELRLLDTAEEITFLALECRELGRADLAARIVSLYRTLCRDDIGDSLLDFYLSRRALLRATSCAWRLDEPLDDELRAHWISRTRRYLAAARSAIERARHRS